MVAYDFCKQKQVNYFFPPISLVLEFLSSFLSNVRSYSTLNTYCSTISLLSSDEGSHSLVKRFFKGVALKLQRPRYDFIWDPSSNIIHLATLLYPYEDLLLEIISGSW